LAKVISINNYLYTYDFEWINFTEIFIYKLFVQTISNKIFHSDYKYITNSLSDSLVKKAYQSFLNHSKNFILLEMISEKSDLIKLYLKHKLKVYKNLLNKKYKFMVQKKLLYSQS